MAKGRKAITKRSSGPYLDAALICEDLVQEKDMAVTPVRLVGRINFEGQPPAEDALLVLPLIFFLSFKAGDVTGERKFSLYVITPSGKRKDFLKNGSLAFQGEDTGAHSAIQIILPYEGNGTYWFEVFMDRKHYSRIPLTVSFKPKT